MSEFKREERFIVIKRKHLSAESRFHESLEQELRVWLDKHLIPTSECVVVESDWPEYETVWSMIAARVEGRPTPYQVIEQQVAALRQHKNDYMEAAEETRRALETEAQALREQVAALRARVVVVQDWQPLTAVGQVETGDLLRFTVGGKEIEAPARLVIAPGDPKEEIVYNRGKNHYFITSMAVDGTSSHKGVMVKRLNGKAVSWTDIHNCLDAELREWTGDHRRAVERALTDAAGRIRSLLESSKA